MTNNLENFQKLETRKFVIRNPKKNLIFYALNKFHGMTGQFPFCGIVPFDGEFDQKTFCKIERRPVFLSKKFQRQISPIFKNAIKIS